MSRAMHVAMQTCGAEGQRPSVLQVSPELQISHGDGIHHRDIGYLNLGSYLDGILPGGVPGRPSVRVASGTIGELVHDSASSRSRRLLQVVALCGVLLLASWLRSDPEPEWP